MGSIVHIVCSDTARTGKTLLSRVFADLSSLRRENNPVVFDTDISGNGIVNYCSDSAQLIDLTQVADQVTLFDSMMEVNEHHWKRGEADRPPDFVVDVAASDLARFFEMFCDIGFERGAREAQLDVRIYYLVSWTLNSLRRTQQVREMLSSSKFYAVRNMAVQAFAFTPLPLESELVPEIDISLFLNMLSPTVFAIVNERAFSFARFITGEYQHLGQAAKSEIWDFLEEIHNRTNNKVAH